MPQKSSDTIAINLRMPKRLHQRLVRDAEKANRSLNKELIARLEGSGSNEIEAIITRAARAAATQAIAKMLAAKGRK